MKIKRPNQSWNLFIYFRTSSRNSIFICQKTTSRRNGIVGNKVWSNARYLIRNFAFEANKIDLNFFTSEKVSTCFSFFYLFSNLESISILPLFHFCYFFFFSLINRFFSFSSRWFFFFYCISRPLICFLLNKTYYTVNTTQIKYTIYIHTRVDTVYD